MALHFNIAPATPKFTKAQPMQQQPVHPDSLLEEMESMANSSAVQVTTEAPAAIHAPKVESDVELETATELVDEEALTDEYIELHTKFESFEGEKICKRMDQIKKQLQLIANEQVDKDEAAVFSSPLGEIEFTKRSCTRTVAAPIQLVEDLTGKFGVKAAFSCIKVGITELKKLLSENEMAIYVKDEPGSRSLKAVRRAS